MAGRKDSTDGTTRKGEAERAIAGVGGIRSSEEDMPDLFWSGENMEERRDATCSAGRKGKEGRGDGPRGLPAPDKVRQLQIILYRKAKSKPGYRFWSLYGEVQRADVLRTAWRRVKANGGTAGVDGETIDDIAQDANSEKEWLEAVREGLHRRNYFALAHYHRIFRQMNGFTANRVRQWLWRKHGNASGKYRRWPDYKLFLSHGLYELPTRVT